MTFSQIPRNLSPLRANLQVGPLSDFDSCIFSIDFLNILWQTCCIPVLQVVHAQDGYRREQPKHRDSVHDTLPLSSALHLLLLRFWPWSCGGPEFQDFHVKALSGRAHMSDRDIGCDSCRRLGLPSPANDNLFSGWYTFLSRDLSIPM